MRTELLLCLFFVIGLAYVFSQEVDDEVQIVRIIRGADDSKSTSSEEVAGSTTTIAKEKDDSEEKLVKQKAAVDTAVNHDVDEGSGVAAATETTTVQPEAADEGSGAEEAFFGITA